LKVAAREKVIKKEGGRKKERKKERKKFK
jgi:hypothetical protein